MDSCIESIQAMAEKSANYPQSSLLTEEKFTLEFNFKEIYSSSPAKILMKSGPVLSEEDKMFTTAVIVIMIL